MPGNEGGDRVHNFFDQSSLSQDQRHPQFGEANWPGFHNNINNNNAYGANERQIGGHLSSSKSFSGQPSEIERGQNNPFSLASHGLNFTQPGVRPEFLKNPAQGQQSNLNGYMHTPQTVNARQNEANFLGMDKGSDRQNLTSRGQSILQSQQRSVPQHNNSASFRGSETPMNFNFLGGQQQLSGQQSGMLQSLPPQQSGMNDNQLMQQHVMFTQMQEVQRRQQLQQFEAMQAMNHLSTFPNQSAEQHSQASNGNPWQSQATAGGTNWQQRGHASAVHAYSNGPMVHPEQGQAMRLMGLTPQQASQSLYGVPVSNAVGSHPFLQNRLDKQGVFHNPALSSPFSGNPYSPHAQQVNMQDGSTASRSGSEVKTSFEHVSSHGLENAADSGGFNQVQQRKVSMSDGGGRGFVGGSDGFPEKSLMQGANSQSTSSQAAIGLDPTEEKILFGNDDNIWEAFGDESVTGNDAADLLSGFPSMQNGTWSALMQSAVAETSSGDIGTQEEWSGLESQNSKPQSRNQHLPTSQDNEKPPPVWIDSSQRASLGSRPTGSDVSANNATSNTNYSQNPSLQQPFSNIRSSPIESQVLQEGRRWLDSSSPKPQIDDKRVHGNPNPSRDLSKDDTGFWSNQQNSFRPELLPNSNTNSKVEPGAPGLRNMNISHEFNQRPPDNHSLDLWKKANFSTNSGIVGSGNSQHNMNKGQSAVNSPADTSGGRVAEMRGIENGDGRESSIDSHQNSFPNHVLPGGSNENAWSEGGRRVPVVRKFQYHPMGDVDIDESSSAKEVFRSQSMSPSLGFKAHAAQPPLHSPAVPSLSDVEKGQASGFHGGATTLHGRLPNSVYPGYLPNISAPFARSGENSSPHQQLPPSQNMLELLHKVDQSTDQKSVPNLSSNSTSYNRSSDIPLGGRVGPGQSLSSSSNSFNLQLAPPSQGITFSNLNDPSQSFLRSVGSPSPQLMSSEKGDNSHARLTSTPSTQFLPPSHSLPQMESGNDKSTSSVSNSRYPKNPFQNQHMTASGGHMMDDHQSSIVSSDRHAYHDQQSIVNQNQSGMRTSMQGGPYLRTTQQQLGVQPCSASDFMKSHFQSNDSSDMSFGQQKKDEVNASRGADAVSSPAVADDEDRTVAKPRLPAKTVVVSHEESIGRQSTEASPSNSAASQKDADVSHQMQGMKFVGMDPSHRESKRLRGPDGMNSLVRDPSASETCVSSGDAKTLRFSPQSDNINISRLPHGSSTSRDSPSFGHSDPPFFPGNVAGRAQFAGVSPQMAPSWFEQYGTLKNGQLLPVHNVPRVPMVNVDQQLNMPPNNLAVQNSAQPENTVIDNTSQISNAYSASGHMDSLHALVPNIPSPCPVPRIPKKRKTATSDLIPWNKEIGQKFKRLQNISSAEVDWAQSSNRVVEKGGDETDSHDDMSSMIRSRRRLILTTKLMQQVVYPPPASILSLDGRSSYEAIMYSSARLALGDACNLICGSESDSPPDNGNLKAETSESIRDQQFLKVVENFTNRAKDLENDLRSLEKRPSMLDLRLECQDLERYSVFNRFARFHGRNQVDGAETSSSSDANGVSLKPPQRYVSALPMPRNVPEGVQCLSL